MTLRQLVDAALLTARQPLDQNDRRAAVLLEVNAVLRRLYKKSRQWPFLQKTAEILSEADEVDYALPSDFSSIVGQLVTLDGEPVELVHPADMLRVTDRSGPVATIVKRTTSPFANVGYVFPTYGSKNILGYGTGFTPNVVGRFFRTRRDGYVYRVKSYTDSQNITLAQEFAGDSVKGRVSVFDDHMNMVVGQPFVTRFSESMIGSLIWIEDTSDAKQIVSVDERNQTISISDSDAFDAAGTDLYYTIQDNYEIDPKGMYVLTFLVGGPDADDEVISVTYNQSPPHLTDENEELPVPRDMEHLVLYAVKAQVAAMFGRPIQYISHYDRIFRESVDDAALNADPLGDVPNSVRLGEIQ